MKIGYQAMLLTLCCLMTPPASALVTYDVKPGDNNPPILLGADQQVLLHIPNEDNQILELSLPDMGVSQIISPLSQNTYFLDDHKFAPRELTYVVKTQDGQVVASGKIINNYIESTLYASLDSFINYNPVYTTDR